MPAVDICCGRGTSGGRSKTSSFISGLGIPFPVCSVDTWLLEDAIAEGICGRLDRGRGRAILQYRFSYRLEGMSNHVGEREEQTQHGTGVLAALLNRRSRGQGLAL